MRYQVRMHPTLDILVSSIGEVFVTSVKGPKEHWTLGWDDGHGYRKVGINGKRYQVHRLVAEAFIPNPDCYDEVDHINRDKSDNRVENLRWADRKMQQDNRCSVDTSLAKYGVRSCVDINSYNRAYYKNNPEFAERVRARSRERMRNYRASLKAKKEV